MINTSSTLEQSSATGWEIVRWWEKRRFEYNAYVGIVGLVSIVLALTAGGAAVKEGEDFVEPFALLPGAALYAAAANLCYTAGWILRCRRLRRSSTREPLQKRNYSSQ